MGERRSYTPGTFCWTDLATTDAGAATAFYTNVFGWRTEVLADQGSGAYTLAHVGENMVAAIFTGTADRPPAWLSYVSVADVDATEARAVELGASVVRSAADMGTSGRMVVLADPTGAVFAAWQAVDHIGAALVNDAGALCMNQLNTNDPDTAARFYGGLFGWRVESVGTEDNPYWGLYNGDALNGGMMPLPPQPPAPPHWLVYFTATDVGAAGERIARLGGRVLVGPMAIPSGRILVAADPQDAIFALFEGRVDP